MFRSETEGEEPTSDDPVNRDRNSIFVSYSHKDRDLVSRLFDHLYVLRRAGLVEAWSDLDIEPGNLWRGEIERALARTRIGVLLVSIDFLNSAFINEVELPSLLRAAREEGVRIIPVILGPCRERFQRTPDLVQFQAANSPDRPIASLSQYERDAFWDNLAARVEDLLREPWPNESYEAAG